MTLITIRERRDSPDGTNATLSFDHQGEYPITITPPFSPEDEQRLEWYFEQHIRFPFVQQVRARQAADSIAAYGEALFNQVFADREAFARYAEARQHSLHALRIEIAGSPEFHALHWEALKDPNLPRPLAIEVPVVRKSLARQPQPALLRETPTINLLVVTARPSGAQDVGYRTISRPLVEQLRRSRVPVQIDILRPGSYEALSKHLDRARDEHGAGFYHVIHFDLHGALMTYQQFQQGVETSRFLYQARYGRDDIQPYEGVKAFLFMEGQRDGQADPVADDELGELLQLHQVPIAILNACQSGKQVGTDETSLGSYLMKTGVQLVLAMRYTVTVSAAEILMRTLYEQLFDGRDLATAIRRGRRELYDRKGRRVYFNEQVDLEDWLLPVVYQNQEVRLQPRPFTPEEIAAFYGRKARRFSPPQPTYGFHGRDLDILEIERRLLMRRNLLLVRGMGGAGKTTLLRHLGSWWQQTGLVEEVFAFGYDERAWTRQQILDAIGRRLWSESDYPRLLQPMPLEVQQTMIAERLRGWRHLLILDNLESITGAELAIQHTLPEAEREGLRRFLAELAGGRTLVLLGSRSGEGWLAPGTFEENVYELGGLDEEAASALADRVLARHEAAQHREARETEQILRLLAGYPLALEVVLANLATQTPAAVLEALEQGDIAIDPQASSQDKTRSILQCIAYSHSNLAPEAQQLLLCLAPFVGAINREWLPQYVEKLKAQPALAGLPFEQWEVVLRAAINWGLLAPHPEARGYLSIQPVLPYFLRSRLASPKQAEVKRAIEAAFRAHYRETGGALANAAMAKEADRRQAAFFLTRLEYENLMRAVELALDAQEPITGAYQALDEYWDRTQEHRRAIEAGMQIAARLEHYPESLLTGEAGFDRLRVLADIARRQLLTQQLDASAQTYQRCLDLIEQLSANDERQRARWRAVAYHNLGTIAQRQRQWEQAERHFKQALQIDIEFNDRYSQARTYHHLGMVAQEQRQWEQAEAYYQQALQIYIEFNDRYEQAGTYHQLGTVAQAQRQWEQAEAYYQQALQIYIEFNDRYEQAGTYHQLGTVAQAQRQWEQAERHFKQALQIYIEFNDRYSQAGTYHQLGRVAQEQHQWEQAEAYYQQALQLFAEFNDRYNQASAYHWLGIVAQEQCQWQRAREYLLTALQLCHECQGAHSRAITLRSLARLQRDSGDPSIAEAVAKILGSPQPFAEVQRQVAEEGNPVAG